MSKKYDSFNDWLNEVLSEDPGIDWYDPNGNSPRAVIVRMREGIFKAIVWECSEILKDLKYFLFQEFEGFETSISWFIQFALIPIIIPISPLTRTYTRYKSAIDEYKKDYELYIDK